MARKRKKGKVAQKRIYVPFPEKHAENLKRKGEELAAKRFVKTEGFEKAVVFWMTLTEDIWKLAQKNESFRMELFYDAEALNVNYCFFVPKSKDELDDMPRES